MPSPIDFVLNRDMLTAPAEMSALASWREPQGLLRNWTHQRQHAKRGGNLTNIASQLQQRFDLGTLARTRMHPFQIYQYPEYLRPFQNANDWQRFKVRDGLFVGQAQQSIETTDGTDKACQSAFDFPNSPNYPWFTYDLINNPPLTNQQPPTDSSTIITMQWNEIVVPADGTMYAFWASACTGNGLPLGICFGNSSTGCTDLYDGSTFNDPWPGFPANDPYHFLIGTVFWNSNKSAWVINQIQTTHLLGVNLPNFGLFNGSTTGDQSLFERFRGIYSSSSYYWAGDVVLQTIASSAGPNWTYRWMYSPIANPSSYPIDLGPITNIDPSTHNPDPWVLTGKFPVNADGTASVDFHTDASYQAAKSYLRTS